MSFGLSIGDIVKAIEVAFVIHEKCFSKAHGASKLNSMFKYRRVKDSGPSHLLRLIKPTNLELIFPSRQTFSTCNSVKISSP